MKLKINDIMKILDKEIEWCNSNPKNKVFHKEYRKGFTNGLIQAKYLISEFKDVLDMEKMIAEM